MQTHTDIQTTPLEAVTAVLIDALRALAASGRTEEANRLAGQAYVALRRRHPRQAERLNVLMHRLPRIPNTI